MSQPTVLVVGAAGMQASSLLRGLHRSRLPMKVVGVDRKIPAGELTDGFPPMRWEQVDILTEGHRLRDLCAEAAVVVNCTGPYFLLGDAVLRAAIDAGTDYLDICDDADATEALLEQDAAVKDAGITALIGMGSAPGTTNILVRLALDNLPDGDAEVEINWVVDCHDMAGAVVPHFVHSFRTAISGASTMPDWDELQPRTVVFPDPIGPQTVVTLSHPELFTLPRFSRVTRAHNRGGLIPVDHTMLGWLLARLPEHPDRATDGAALSRLFDGFASRKTTHTRLGSGLIVDVRVGSEGYRYSSGATTTQEDATGVPAAAGVLVALDGKLPGPGAIAPELLSPADFFAALRLVSAGGGGLSVARTRDGVETEPARIRDLIAQSAQHTTPQETR
ncbi:saccharopine dehydrogenase family protein [Streptomyces qaidamensis]|uniref:saccharopine dehydrogenase family protein n=1 Tax=Streptomyces qaidamensis TaxID=1783515 RepID=UPI0036494D99